MILIGAIAPGSGNPYNGTVNLMTDLNYPRGLRNDSGLKTGPRFGFAYDPFGSGKTAIRGSFSVLQDLLPASSDLGRNVPGFAPYSRVSTFLYGRIPDLAGTVSVDAVAAAKRARAEHAHKSRKRGR